MRQLGLVTRPRRRRRCCWASRVPWCGAGAAVAAAGRTVAAGAADGADMRAAAGAEVEDDGVDDDGAERFAVAQHEEVRSGERYFLFY